MNIVIFTDSFLPKIDGVSVSIDHFCRRLADRGHKFVICCPRYGPEDKEDLGSNIRLVRFWGLPLPSYPEIKLMPPSIRRIRQAMTHFKPDLIHIQTPGLLGQFGLVAARIYNLPHITTYHTLVSEQWTYISLFRLLRLDRIFHSFGTPYPDEAAERNRFERRGAWKKRMILYLNHRFYETSRLIIAPSQLIKDFLLEQGIRTPVTVLSNGMDLSEFRARRNRSRPTGPPRLLHVGRISYEKNCEVVIRAFALILERRPDCLLDIVGDGPAIRSLKKEAQRLGLKERVRFLGFRPREELPDLYPAYDLFLTASTMETQGLVILEALGCGLPCIGVDAYALPELIRHGENGFICRPFDHREMARRSLQLIEDRRLHARCSAAARRMVKKHDIRIWVDRLEEIYGAHGLIDRDHQFAGSEPVRKSKRY